jgi:hypothetical protein
MSLGRVELMTEAGAEFIPVFRCSGVPVELLLTRMPQLHPPFLIKIKSLLRPATLARVLFEPSQG